jgi:hypothetical protein
MSTCPKTPPLCQTVDNYRVFGGKLYVLGENFLLFAGGKISLAVHPIAIQANKASPSNPAMKKISPLYPQPGEHINGISSKVRLLNRDI